MFDDRRAEWVEGDLLVVSACNQDNLPVIKGKRPRMVRVGLVPMESL